MPYCQAFVLYFEGEMMERARPFSLITLRNSSKSCIFAEFFQYMARERYPLGFRVFPEMQEKDILHIGKTDAFCRMTHNGSAITLS